MLWSYYTDKIGTGVVSWMSKCQPIVALFTTEAEYMTRKSSGCASCWKSWVSLWTSHLSFTSTTSLLSRWRSIPNIMGGWNILTCTGFGSEMWWTRVSFHPTLFPLIRCLLIYWPRLWLESKLKVSVRCWDLPELGGASDCQSCAIRGECYFWWFHLLFILLHYYKLSSANRYF